MMEDDTLSEMQDFSLPSEEPLRFKIDDDLFEAAPRVGAYLLQDVIDMSDAASLSSFDGTGGPEETARASSVAVRQMAKATTFLDAVLLDDSAARFAERLRSTTNPISFDQVFQVWQWLIGKYGSRPTRPSSPSVNGHDGTGTSSTAGALPGV